MTRPPPSDSVRSIVENILPNIKVISVSMIPTQRIVRPFEVRLADGKTLLLNLSPPPSRLLRAEQWSIQSEAVVVDWLSKDIVLRKESNTRLIDRKNTDKITPRTSSRPCDHQSVSELSIPLTQQLAKYLPTLIKHSLTTAEHRTPFGLYEPSPGEPLSTLARPLTEKERRGLDFQSGCLMRRIVELTSPNGSFGLAVTVLGSPPSIGDARGKAREPTLDFSGTTSWRKTFHSLLESILRDGEDLGVTVSYELVRKTFHRFAHLLDAVTTPRLVVFDIDEDENQLVSRREQNHGGHTEEEMLKLSIREEEEGEGEGEGEEPEECTIQLTGLRDWSNCIFGDPLFATVFSHASPEFERGFHQRPGSRHSDDERHRPQGRRFTDVIEDPDNAATRILLYECYHATVSIVRQFYRPSIDSSGREIVARRRLTAALAKLDHVMVKTEERDGPAGKRPRRPSREDFPVKRSKSDMELKKEEL
ncbi:hypothetical protein GGR57DRAFT_232632 [Xylariaceae sp. FL1272]|nr:hypothetical protein GGR57DRAFT_232632 [Xylariaceae sp. FL1272]